MWRLLLLCTLVCCSDAVDEIKLGDDAFANVCARCHGQDGTGGVAATNGVRPRDLTDPAWQASLGDGQIEAVIRIGKPPMPAFQPALSNAGIRSVVAKVRRLRRKETR